MYKALIACLILLFLMIACGSDDSPSRPQATPFPTEVPWQRALQPISSDNAASLQLIGRIDEHAATVNNVVFSNNSLYLATNSLGDERVRVWNLASGRSALNINSLNAHAILFGADNETLITITIDQDISEWQLFTEERTQSLQAQNASVGPVTQSVDQRRIAIGGAKGRVYLFTTAPLQAQGYIDANPIIAIYQVLFTPDGEHLLTLADGGSIKYWEFAEGDQPLHDFGSFDPKPLQLALSPDGLLFAAAFPDEIRLWRLDTYQVHSVLSIPQHAASEYLAFSPDGLMLVGYSSDAMVTFWNVSAQRRIVQFPLQGEQLGSLIFSQNSQLLLSATQGPHLYLWNLEVLRTPDLTGEIQIPRSPQLAPAGAEVFRAAWSPNNQWIAVADTYGDIFVLGIPEGN